jgi:hypothetical protein
MRFCKLNVAIVEMMVATIKITADSYTLTYSVDARKRRTGPNSSSPEKKICLSIFGEKIEIAFFMVCLVDIPFSINDYE